MNDTSSTVNHNAYMASAPQIDYALIAHHPSECSSLKIRLVVPVFQKGDDPIDAINHMMSLLTSVVTSRVTIQPIQERQNHMSAGSSRPFASGSGGTSRRQRVIMCYNCKVQTDEPNLSGTTIVKVPKELPKVSMVNSCLKKLKFHLANFDMVVKERTIATAITEGTWGFEHTKACFRDDIIPFVQRLKDLFTFFDQWLIDEVTEVQNVFTQMELAIEQHCKEKSKVQTKMENVLQENDRLLTQALSVEIVNIVVHENMKSVCLNVIACSRSKMIAKQNDPQLIENKVITKPIDYATLNQLSTDFNTRFVPQTESYAEQAFWSQYSVQTDKPTHSGTTIVEVPKELPKVSMVNSCLKKLKYHLASFDIVVKERTTDTAITKGT
nr:hypothetical protein [Tanacetum cinerariifolium]